MTTPLQTKKAERACGIFLAARLIDDINPVGRGFLPGQPEVDTPNTAQRMRVTRSIHDAQRDREARSGGRGNSQRGPCRPRTHLPAKGRPTTTSRPASTSGARISKGLHARTSSSESIAIDARSPEAYFQEPADRAVARNGSVSLQCPNHCTTQAQPRKKNPARNRAMATTASGTCGIKS